MNSANLGWFLGLSLLVVASACGPVAPPTEGRTENEEITRQDQFRAKRLLFAGEEKLRSWLSYYERRIPGLRIGDFLQRDSFKVDSFLSFPYTPNPVFEPLLVSHESGELLIDIVSYGREIATDVNGRTSVVGGSPDDSAMLIAKDKVEAVRLLFCGTPCMFQDAAWLSDTELVVAGLSSHVNISFQPALWYINIPQREIILFTHPQEVLPGDFMYLEEQLEKLNYQ